MILNLSPSNPGLLRFAAVLSLQDFGHFHSSTRSGPIEVAHYSGGPLCSIRQQAVWNIVQTFPEPARLERVCRPSAWLTCSQNNGWLWLLSAAPGVPKTSPIQVLSRPNITQLQCWNENCSRCYKSCISMLKTFLRS